jgi:hypothetical protein
MAAAGFGTAESNATQLGKALQDPIKGITALNRAGITFTADQKELIKSLVESGKVLEAQNLILTEIESQVGGTAEATVTASQKMNIAFGEIQESLGQAVLPLFERLASWFIRVLPDIQRFISAMINAFDNPQVKAAFESLGKSLGNLGESLAKLFGITAGPEANGFVSFFVVLAQILDGIVQTVDLLVKTFKNAFPVFNTFANLVNSIANALVSISGYEAPQLPASGGSAGRSNSPRSTGSFSGSTTININKGNVTATEIVRKINKKQKVTGRRQIRNFGSRRAI